MDTWILPEALKELGRCCSAPAPQLAIHQTDRLEDAEKVIRADFLDTACVSDYIRFKRDGVASVTKYVAKTGRNESLDFL